MLRDRPPGLKAAAHRYRGRLRRALTPGTPAAPASSQPRAGPACPARRAATSHPPARVPSAVRRTDPLPVRLRRPLEPKGSVRLGSFVIMKWSRLWGALASGALGFGGAGLGSAVDLAARGRLGLGNLGNGFGRFA